MQPEQVDALIPAAKRVLRSRKPYHWWMCLAGEDGEPILLLAKRLDLIRQPARLLRRSAKDKRQVGGLACKDAEGNLIFGIEEGSIPPNVASRALRMQVAKDPSLRKVKVILSHAEVLDAASFAARLQTPTDDDLPDALIAAEKDAKAAYTAAKRKLGPTDPTLARLDTLRKQAQKDAKAGKLEDAIDAFESLTELAESV